MKITTLTVKGQNLKRLVDRLCYNYGRKYNYSSGSVSVFVNEEYYLRINSNLTTTVITNLNDDGSCAIEFVSSGGGEGISGFTWGSEGKSLNEFIDLINILCKENSWSYEIN